MKYAPMHPIKCRCGKKVTHFHMNIGDFYIDKCCKEAGFDHLGNRKATPEDLAKLGPVVSQTKVSMNYGTGAVESAVETKVEENGDVTKTDVTQALNSVFKKSNKAKKKD